MSTTKLRIKELLRERRWATKILAEKTGLSESYLTHIKNGTRRWNADALEKISQAFGIFPTEMFFETKKLDNPLERSMKISESAKDVKFSMVPVIGSLISEPTQENNISAQERTGFNGRFLPVIGDNNESSMFCLSVQDNSMSPVFSKGDLLVISPESWVNSGEFAAVEFGENTKTLAIKKVSFTDDVILLDSINHTQAPVALVRGKDSFKIIGKVIIRVQNF